MATRPSEPWEGQTFADQKSTQSGFAPLLSAFLAALQRREPGFRTSAESLSSLAFILASSCHFFFFTL